MDLSRRKITRMLAGLGYGFSLPAPVWASAIVEDDQNRGPVPDNFSIIFEETFSFLDLRVGGPTDRGLFHGAGRWTPRYFWNEADPKPGAQGYGTGSAIGFGTPQSEGAWFVDPTSSEIASTKYSPFSIDGRILRVRTEKRPKLLDGKLPINADIGKEYEWVSGLLTSRHSFYFKPPAYVEARIKFAGGFGLWSAFWLATQETNGVYYFEPPFESTIPWEVDKPSTEIDIAEYLPEHGADNMYHAWHWNEPNDPTFHGQGEFVRGSGDFSNDFHVYGCLWESDKVSFFVDDSKVFEHRLPAKWVSSFMYLILGGATVGGRKTWASPPDQRTPDHVDTLYDWVRVWGSPQTAHQKRF